MNEPKTLHNRGRFELGIYFEALVIPLAISLVIFRAVLYFGMIHFGGMDGSAISQGAWRYYLGQHPYKDFQMVINPSYVIMPGLTFKVLGVKWKSVVLLGALFSSLAFLVHYSLLRRIGLRWILASLLAVVVQTITMLPVSWWTYNQTTSVYAVLFVTAACALVRNPLDLKSAGIVTVLMLLLSWEKPLIAGFLLAAVFIILVSNRATRFLMLRCGIAASIASVMLLIFLGVNPLLMAHSYFDAGGRLGRLGMMYNAFIGGESLEAVGTLFILSPILFALVGQVFQMRHCKEKPVPGIALACVAIFGGFLGMATNNEHNMVDVPLILIGTAFFFFYEQIFGITKSPSAPHGYLSENFKLGFHKERFFRELPRMIFVASLILYGLWGAYFTVTRERIKSIGPEMFYEDQMAGRLIAPPFFEGMWVGPRFAGVLSEVDYIMHQLKPKILQDNSVFFGPRMEFGYAAYNIQPATGLSLWWMGTGEASPDTIEQTVEAFKIWRPTVGIFLKNDFTYMPQSLLDFFRHNYIFCENGNLTILWLQTESLPTFLNGLISSS